MNRTLSLPLSLVAVAAAVLAPSAAAAQDALQQAETFASHAQADSARAILELWWEADWADAPREQRQHGLWLRARLTVDPLIAEVDYQRLVEEFPGGPYSDRALSRLALLSVAEGNSPSAADYYEALVSEYPNSSHRDEAQEWLRRNAPEVRRARVLAEDDREVVSAPEEPVSAPEEPVSPVAQPAGEFAVQLGAFSEVARAQALADRLQAAGYEARLVRVPANRLVRVRAGYFGERDAAVTMMLEIRESGFEATLVSDATREEHIR